MWARPYAARFVCLATCVGLVAGGCTQTRIDMVAKYHPGTPSTVDRTPDVGVYKIKFAAGEAGGELHTLRGSKRFLGKGQPLGFVHGEDGAIIAVAGEERFPAKLPPHARFCVWYRKTKEPTEFAQGALDAGELMGKAALAGVVYGGLLILTVALDLDDDDDCRHGLDEDLCDKCRH
jgi:hypothetical protein